MTLEECYKAMDGDYAEVLSRLENEDTIKKVMLMFLTDDSFDKLYTSMMEKRYDDAYADAIGVKGITGNMGFGGLYRCICDIVEALKIRKSMFARCTDEDLNNLMLRAKKNYDKTIAAISEFKKENTVKKRKSKQRRDNN